MPSAVSIASSDQPVFPLHDITQEMERMIKQGNEHLLFCVNNFYLCNLLAGILWELEVIREMEASFSSPRSQSPPFWGLAPYPPVRCTQAFTDLTTSTLRQGLFLTRFTSQMMIWDTLFVILKLMFPVLLHEQCLKWLEWYPRRHLYSDKLIGPILLLSAVASK